MTLNFLTSFKGSLRRFFVSLYFTVGLLSLVNVVTVSAHPIIIDQSHHTGISEVYTYDEIESSILTEVDSTGRLSSRKTSVF